MRMNAVLVCILFRLASVQAFADELPRGNADVVRAGSYSVVDSIALLQRLSSSQMANGAPFFMTGFRSNSNEGAGTFTWFTPAMASATADVALAGGTVTVSSIGAGQIVPGAKIAGAGTIFEQPKANGGTGLYSEPSGVNLRAKSVVITIIPNGKTIIAPTGHGDCSAGCLVKTDYRQPSLEDFGLSQYNAAAANRTAMLDAIASTTFTGSPGQFNVGAGGFHYNGPIKWPSGVFVVGRGAVASRFLQDNCGDGFDVAGTPGGITNVVGSHFQGFLLSPSCTAPTGTGGVSLNAINADQVDEFSDISIQSVLGRGHGGIGFICSGCSHALARNITATGINGTGIIINNSGEDTCNGFQGEALNAFNNVTTGVLIDCNDATTVRIHGSAEGNGPNTGGTQVTVARGFGLDVEYHIEGCPTVSSGLYCAVVGNATGNSLAFARLRFDLANVAQNGLAVVNILSGEGLDVRATSANGAGYDPTSIFYNVSPLCNECRIYVPGRRLPVINRSSTSRQTFPPD